MSAAAGVIAIVLTLFFVTGIAVGIVVVIAVSARRADAAYRRDNTAGQSFPLPPLDPDDDDPDQPPWWPGSRGY
jgi:hypothetical protein